MKMIMSQYESLIIERKLELKNLNVQKDNLQTCITHIRNNSEEYSKIIDAVKREMKDARQILMLALQSIVESARKDDGKLFALIYNLPTTSSHFPDYNTNEDIYERILLNEAEDLYDGMITNHMDKAINDTIRKSELFLKPEDGLDNFKIEYKSEKNNDIKKDDLQLGKGQNA